MEKGSDIHSVSPPCSRVVHEICGSKCIASLVRLFLKIVHWNEPNAIAANSIYQRTFPHQIWIIRPVARADTEIIAAPSISSDFWIRGEWNSLLEQRERVQTRRILPSEYFSLFFFRQIMCVCVEGLHMEGPCQALKSVTGGIKNKWLMKWLTHRDLLGDVCSFGKPAVPSVWAWLKNFLTCS